MLQTFKSFTIRTWQASDRHSAANLIGSVLAEYGLSWDPEHSDRDVLDVERCYQDTGGEFWVVEQDGQLVGTVGYYPVPHGDQAVELRKMYLLPAVRGQGLGKFLLQQAEIAITARGFSQIWIETATVLKEAVLLYERYGYSPPQDGYGPDTPRCDRVYVKYL